MNTIDYLNSYDVATYLMEIGYEFNAMQAAYVIYINDWLTIEERIKLWQEIIDTMPDCTFQHTSNKSITVKPSAHAAIRQHIEKVTEDLEAFMIPKSDEGQEIYIPISSRWEKRPEWVRVIKEFANIGRGLWNTCTRGVPFTSFEKCIQYLKDQSDLYERSNSWGKYEPFDRHRIGRTTLDKGDGDCYKSYPGPESLNYFMERVTLNGNYEPIDINMDWYGNVFEDLVPEIPHPFEQGDIVIDTTRSESFPFVFDRCVTWTLEDEDEALQRRAHFYDMLDKKGVEYKERIVYRNMYMRELDAALADRCSIAGSCYFGHGHMYVYGYKVNAYSEDSILKYDWSGACDNFLNLEYYRGAFNGRLSILPTVSWFVMNENRVEPDSVFSSAKTKVEMSKKFEDRGIEAPDASSYDICLLVNEGFKLG